MNLNEAKGILFTLARGIDPRTGKALNIHDICNDVEVVRALYLILSFLDYENQEPPSDPYLKNKCSTEFDCGFCNESPWSDEDENMLIRMVEDGYEKRTICTYFSRCEDDIAEKLIELGVVSNSVQFFNKQ